MQGMNSAADFEAFVRRYQDMVFATAVRLLGNPADAEDAAQTVFLRAYQRYAEVVPSPTAAGWLRTTTRNLCLNQLARYRSRWRFFSELGDEGRGEYGDRIESGVLPIVEQLERQQTTEALEDALRALPEHQRVPLVLFHFEEMSYDEIARTLGVSLGKIKTDMHRGRETLRRALTSGG
jgi:RNA polymerase sigma-70 factor (ECF subfamily)